MSIVTSAPGLAMSHSRGRVIDQHGHEAVLQRVVAEDVGELGAHARRLMP